jgi:hypothetical protein
MTTLTHLSDDELDAVTGGFFNFTNIAIAKNFSITQQTQENVNVSAFSFVAQGGAQIAVTKQVAIV